MRLFGKVGGTRGQFRAAMMTPIFDLSLIPLYESQTLMAQSIFSGSIRAQAVTNTLQAQAIPQGSVRVQQ